MQRGALLFRKEFYDSGICVDANGQEQSLKAFARNWIKVVEPGENQEELDEGQEQGSTPIELPPPPPSPIGHLECSSDPEQNLWSISGGSNAPLPSPKNNHILAYPHEEVNLHKTSHWEPKPFFLRCQWYSGLFKGCPTTPAKTQKESICFRGSLEPITKGGLWNEPSQCPWCFRLFWPSSLRSLWGHQYFHSNPHLLLLLLNRFLHLCLFYLIMKYITNLSCFEICLIWNIFNQVTKSEMP